MLPPLFPGLPTIPVLSADQQMSTLGRRSYLWLHGVTQEAHEPHRSLTLAFSACGPGIVGSLGCLVPE